MGHFFASAAPLGGREDPGLWEGGPGTNRQHCLGSFGEDSQTLKSHAGSLARQGESVPLGSLASLIRLIRTEYYGIICGLRATLDNKLCK